MAERSRRTLKPVVYRIMGGSTVSAKPRVPSLRHHKPSGQAVVTLSGRDVYLGPHGSPEAMHFLGRRLESLNLTEKQKDAVREIKNRVMKETIRKRADLEIAGVELRELLHKDSVDMSAVEAKLKKAEALRTDLRLSHIKAREEIKALLTPEQRNKFKEEMKAAFMVGGKKHDGMRHPCDPKDAVQKREKKEDVPEK